MGTYYAQGIILRHQNVREADRLLTVYTREYGKQYVIARGARKITSKLAGSLEPLSEVRFMFARGRQFDTVTAAEVITQYSKLKQDPQKVLLASYLGMVLDRVTKEHQREVRIYQLLEEVMSVLNRYSFTNKRQSVLVWFFVWRLVHYLGQVPELYACVVCHQRISGTNNHFDLGRGGVVCHRCHPSKSGTVVVSANAIKLLRLMLKQSLTTIRQVAFTTPLAVEVNAITSQYLNYSQEGDFAIQAFILSEKI